ncbi:interleukin-15 receptor subunit alpha isoform X1 [Fundulus heteroclitus]|uniref:interleukin-15 receptor subunit alpha isoform X1 n=1 Tax=Fundulus heteroclitus TaxID=8078 RepID=UPI000644D411|nr:interleukin-15 receptor subunit alpha isoform X1 [Fundulus heteroclitus]
MDPDRFSTSLCVMMVCFLGTTPLPSTGDCECPKIPQRNFTLPENSCFQIDSRYRYQCIPGYVRKAGTSSLIKCVKEQVNSTPNWTASQLECIPYPRFTSQPPNSPGFPTEAPNWPETSTSHQSVITSTSEATKSADKDQSPLGTGNTTILQPCTVQSSTHSPSNPNNLTSSVSDTFKEADPKIVGVSLSVVILLFALGGMLFFLYRRRERPIPTRQSGEMEPMNNPA